MNIIVIGAGLSGLTVGYSAKKAGDSIVVLEKNPHVGGAVRSERRDGYLLEYGPNTVQSQPALFELIRELGLESQMLVASPKTPRYIQYEGKLHEVPLSPAALPFTQLLSFSGKTRLLKEPFIPPRLDESDESLYDFSARRFGEEVAERLVAPFVSGVWAGNAAELAAASSFPRLVEMETSHGSIIKSALRSNKKPTTDKTPKGMISFPEGIETFTRKMAETLGSDLRRGVIIKKIERNKNLWTVTSENETWSAERLVLSLPATEAAHLIEAFAPEAAHALLAIPYAPVAVIHLGISNECIGQPHSGFGFLAAPREKSDILGCLWSSNLFPGRAPDGHSLWTIFMGGSTNPSILKLLDKDLISHAVEAVRPLMGLQGSPAFARVTRYERAIPQYTLGHRQRMKFLDEAERFNEGLLFAANYRGGISVGDVVRSAKQAYTRACAQQLTLAD